MKKKKEHILDDTNKRGRFQGIGAGIEHDLQDKSRIKHRIRHRDLSRIYGIYRMEHRIRTWIELDEKIMREGSVLNTAFIILLICQDRKFIQRVLVQRIGLNVIG